MGSTGPRKRADLVSSRHPHLVVVRSSAKLRTATLARRLGTRHPTEGEVQVQRGALASVADSGLQAEPEAAGVDRA
jgi:hypothetical protein